MAAGLRSWTPSGRLQFDSNGYHGLLLDTFLAKDGVPGTKSYDITGAILQAAVLPLWPTFNGGITGIPFVAYATTGANSVSWSWPDWFGKGNPWYIPSRIIVYTRT